MKNPYINALVAFGYIVGLVFVMFKVVAQSQIGQNTTILAPMAVLCLLVLSVALMGVLFFYEPARLFLENHKREALTFFLKTVVTFACLLAILLILVVYSSYVPLGSSFLIK